MEDPTKQEAKPRRARDGDEIVVRIRRRRARPDWSLRRATGWAIVVVAGEPLLVLLPVAALVMLLLIALGIGAPARAEVIVPLLTAPPADSYQDIGIAGLAGYSGAGLWATRIAFAAGRTLLIAAVSSVAVLRAEGFPADTAAIRTRVRARPGTFALLGAASFGYALLVSGQVSLDPDRDATLAATALMAGMLVLPGAFVAAARGRGPLRAIGRGIATRRPLGHVILVVGYGAAVNGLYRLASFGEPAQPRALPLTLYAVAVALTTAVFVAALARRAVLLDPPGAAPRSMADEEPEPRTKAQKRT